jgi:hypothetical protein
MTLCANSSHHGSPIEQIMTSHIWQLLSRGAVCRLVFTSLICLCNLYATKFDSSGISCVFYLLPRISYTRISFLWLCAYEQIAKDLEVSPWSKWLGKLKKQYETCIVKLKSASTLKKRYETFIVNLKSTFLLNLIILQTYYIK